MKNILFMIAFAFVFSACNKCVECTHDDYERTMYDENGNLEDYGDYIEEVCSDNFESKKDYKDYIDEMEDQDWECKSDFWN